MFRRGRTQAQIAINNEDVIGVPSETDGALTERILEAQALLMRQDLLGRLLANVNDRFAGQMLGCNEFG